VDILNLFDIEIGPFRFVLLLHFQHGARHGPIEKIDQRAHEKGGKYRADADEGGNIGNRSASEKKHGDSYNNANRVGCYSDIFEFTQLPFFCHNYRDSIVCGNSEICRHIERRGEAERYESDNEEYYANRNSRSGEYKAEQPLSEFYDISE
jgi:hypothetical protein